MVPNRCHILISHELPAGTAYSQEHAQIAVGYYTQRDEEHEAAQHQRVALIGRGGRHVIPCA